MIPRPDEHSEQVSKRLLTIRDRSGLSQQDFADELGISLRSAQNYERGIRKLPAETLTDIARKFEIDPLWVIYGPEERPRPAAHVGVDQDTLSRAIEVVQQSILKASANVDAHQFAKMTAAAYKFYMHNLTGAGADELIESFVAGIGQGHKV